MDKLILSQEDWHFISSFETQFPYIKERLTAAFSCTPYFRFEKSFFELNGIVRDGYVHFGKIPEKEAETVGQHTAESVALALDICEGYEDLKNLSQMLHIHDISEAITLDINLYRHNISTEDKHRLEHIAAQVIFEHPDFHHYLDLWREYMAHESTTSKLAHMIDKGQLYCRVAMYEKQYEPKNFQIFWDNSTVIQSGSVEEVKEQLKYQCDVIRGFYQDTPQIKVKSPRPF